MSDRLFDTQKHLFDKAEGIMKSKNADYSNPESTGDDLANFRGSTKVQVPVPKGIYIRLGDKMSRIETFLNRGTFEVDESIEDTVVDAINYLVILYHSLKAPGCGDASPKA